MKGTERDARRATERVEGERECVQIREAEV